MLARLVVRHPRLTRTMITLLLLFLYTGMFAGWRALLNAEREQSIILLQLEVDSLAQQLESRFALKTDALDRFAARWEYLYNRPDRWHADAQMLHRDFDTLQTIQWLDRDYRMRWIEPYSENEATANVALTTDHPAYPYAHRARKDGSNVLTNSFLLPQGKAALAYYVPVYRNVMAGGIDVEHFDGLISGVFRVDQVLQELLRGNGKFDLSMAFMEHDKTLFSHHAGGDLEVKWVVGSPVTLGDNNSFRLQARPTPNLIASTTTHLPLMMLIAGLLASISVCYALWLALLSAQRSEALRASNDNLRLEVDRRQAIEESLQQNQARLTLILDMTNYSHDALFIVGLAPQELVYMNRTCWHSLGYSEAELLEELAFRPTGIIPDIHSWERLLKDLSQKKGGSEIYQRHALTGRGSMIPLEISVQHLQRNGRDYLICVGRNNKRQLEATARLEDLSNHDALTGLYNRRLFDERIDSEWRRLTRHKGRLGLLMIDVDHFKPFNDTLGHQAGDDALKRLAEALSGSLLREGDAVCRYGGEEFVVILPGADREQCGKVAEHLHQAVADLHIDHPASGNNRLSVSIGAASVQPSANTDPGGLIEMADKALYQAKACGRNQTQIATAASESVLR